MFNSNIIEQFNYYSLQQLEKSALYIFNIISTLLLLYSKFYCFYDTSWRVHILTPTTDKAQHIIHFGLCRDTLTTSFCNLCGTDFV